MNNLLSFYIKSNKISSFNSLSLIREYEDYIKSNQNKCFQNLEESKNEIFDIKSLNDKRKLINFSESFINFSLIHKKKLNNFEFKNLNYFTIMSNGKKTIFEIEKNKDFIIKNNSFRLFKNVLESNIESLIYKPVSFKNEIPYQIKKENEFSIEIKKKKKKKKIRKNSIKNNSDTISEMKKPNFINQQNEIINNNFELISNKKDILNKVNKFEEVISFNIINNDLKKNGNNLMISHLNIDYLPKKKKQIKHVNFMKREWIELPNKIIKYANNYNKSFVFHYLIEYMKKIKKKNVINRKGQKILKKYLKKKDSNIKSNFFTKYKDIIKIEKIIEKYTKQNKKIKSKKIINEKVNSINNNEKILKEFDNYNNIKTEESYNRPYKISFKIPKSRRGSENLIRLNNELLIKSINQNDKLEFKNGLLKNINSQFDNVISQDNSKKLVSMKALKTVRKVSDNNYKPPENIIKPLNNNPTFNYSNRKVLKKKPINIVNEVKNSYLENLIKIKDTQNKKKSFNIWKKLSKPKKLLSIKKSDIKKEIKPKRQLKVKYIKKKPNKSKEKNNSDSLSSNSSKGYKQMKIIHKIFDGTINESNSSKLSETFTNVFENLNIKDSLILDKYLSVNKIILKCKKFILFDKWKNNIIKIRRNNRKVTSNKKHLVKYLLMMMIYNFTYLEQLKKSLNKRRDYLLGKSLFIWYRHFYCFHKTFN